jgi:2-haloacid dehalogenase
MIKHEKITRKSKGNLSCVPVFDFGGVLFDWNPRYLFRKFFDGDAESLERFLVEIDFWSWDAGMDRGRPFAEAVGEWSVKFPRYADLIRAFDTRWEETVGGPIPGTEDLLIRLHRAGYPLYGLSNWSAEKFLVLRRKYSHLEVFKKILLSGEVGITKPDLRIFDLFLSRTGLEKESLLFIDDSEDNITAAFRMGWKAIRFFSAEQIEGELAERGLL